MNGDSSGLAGSELHSRLVAEFAGSSVVVTGAAGFIGSHVCAWLCTAGARVVGVDDLSTGDPGNLPAAPLASGELTFLRHDVCEPLDIGETVDHVLHLACPASPRDYLLRPLQTLSAGATGTRNMLDLAEAKQAKFLLASTSEVYGDPLTHPQHEDYWGNVNPIGPRSVYDEAKRYAEALTSAFGRERGLSTAIVRIFNTYGPRMRPDDGRAVPAFFSAALTGLPLTVAGDGSQTRSLCYVSDTVTGVLAAAAQCDPLPINIGNPQEIPIIELAETIRRLCGSTARLAFVDLPEDDPRRRCPDISRAQRILGWSPRIDLLEGLSLTLASLRSESASV